MKNNSKYVDKSELLYRYIRSNKVNTNPKHYTVEESGNILIDRAAFLGGVKPSVNRAKLTRCPKDTKERCSDGVIGIWTKDVKAISLPDYPNYTVDVEITPKITPEKTNIAHAEIVLLPEQNGMTRSISRLFRKSLADISVCIVKPNPL